MTVDGAFWSAATAVAALPCRDRSRGSCGCRKAKRRLRSPHSKRGSRRHRNRPTAPRLSWIASLISIGAPKIETGSLSTDQDAVTTSSSSRSKEMATPCERDGNFFRRRCDPLRKEMQSPSKGDAIPFERRCNLLRKELPSLSEGVAISFGRSCHLLRKGLPSLSEGDGIY